MTTKGDLFEVMRLALRRNPTASRKEAFGYFLEAVVDNSKWFATLAEEYFYGNYEKFDIEQIGRGHSVVVPRSVQSRASSQERVTAELAILKTQVRSVILLDMVLPCGKRLRHATFADCKKAGGWLTEVSKKGKPTQAVDKALDEADLQNIWKRYERAA